MKKEQFKDITLTIPAHVQETMYWTQWVEDVHAEFTLQLQMDKKGVLRIYDLMGHWQKAKEKTVEWESGELPENAWQMVKDWRSSVDVETKKLKLQQQIDKLQAELNQLEPPVKKRGWFK